MKVKCFNCNTKESEEWHPYETRSMGSDETGEEK